MDAFPWWCIIPSWPFAARGTREVLSRRAMRAPTKKPLFPEVSERAMGLEHRPLNEDPRA